MGAKLGKNKKLSISKNVNEQEKEVTTISNNHKDKTATLERKTKKKEKISKKKSSDTKVDKYTSTAGAVVSSSAYIRHLVNGSGHNLSIGSIHSQENSRRPSETPSKDVQDLRDACARRGIIPSETNSIILPISIEQDNQINTENTVEQSTNEIPTVNDTNNEPIQNEQEQVQNEQQHVQNNQEQVQNEQQHVQNDQEQVQNEPETQIES